MCWEGSCGIGARLSNRLRFKPQDIRVCDGVVAKE